MATPDRRRPGSAARPRPGRQRWEDRAQVAIMLLVGGAAGAASFTHVHDVAAGHGQPGWLAWADAIVLELMSIAAGLELRRKRRLGTSVVFPAAVLVVAVSLSLAAQVVEAEASVIGWTAAALPALGFLAMVKIALGRADPTLTRTTSQPARTEDGRPRIVHASVPGTSLPVPVTATAVRDSATAVPAIADQPPAVPDRPDREESTGGGGPEVAALVPAARTAVRTLVAEGTPLSRKALARQLRADGHQLSNATASALVRVLRAETTPPEPDLSLKEAT
ncbi:MULTISPECIES: DUF2637 domain-containing protein [unclassified Micromonospora]|uniref:DUF2637 domain-containing protein n=1 Tax=unclassified Micromonospora TaxID=2617518 RepID=UPI001C250275|nr:MULTISPECIES: DUF2637 domain-containing protein [unclassified Micromonospora]MBU8858053.1 DUF2637 domain-containing protein [Micromonospora sp. WMMB482]MDM4783689.1 DUF2637 domain-containing protein [Micromonospora sp. b486]